MAGSAYFLDVDGTLLEIKPRPEDVVADAGLRALLSEISAGADGALALVSGRKIEDLDRIFAPLIFPAAGLHGAEIRYAGGARVAPPEGTMDQVRQPLADFVATHPALRLEDKGAALAIHFRQVPDLAETVLNFAGALAKRHGLFMQEGKMVAELKDPRHDKGQGIAALLATSPFSGRLPVFIGDDRTDENGFLFVNAQGGVSVRSGSAGVATQARYQLRDPDDVRMELQQLLGSLKTMRD